MNHPASAELSRRQLFFGLLGATTVLVACERRSDVKPEPVPNPEQLPSSSPDPKPSPGGKDADASTTTGTVSKNEADPYGAMDCAEVAKLDPQSQELREKLAYIPKSNNAKQRCSNCTQWVPPKDTGLCGGCKLFTGPVNANGYCMGFAPTRA